MGTPNYNSSHYDTLVMKPPKGWKEAPQEAARQQNMSFTKYIMQAVADKMKRDMLHGLVFPSTSNRTYGIYLTKHMKPCHVEVVSEENLLRTDTKGALRFVVDDDHTITIMPAIDALEKKMKEIGDFISDVKSDDAKALADEILQNFISHIIYAPSEGKKLSEMYYVKYTKPNEDPLIVISSDKRLIVQYLYNEVNLDNNEDWKIEEMEGEEQ